MKSDQFYIRLSKYLFGTLRSKVRDSTALSYKHLIGNHYIDRIPNFNGVYCLLGSGNRVFHKLCALIDIEMRSIGAHRIAMPSLSLQEPWKQSGRFEEMQSDIFSFKGRKQLHYLLSPTHEECVTTIIQRISPVSESALPIKLYQIGRKFRDEKRPQKGLLRGIEFEMKDLYSFDKNFEEAEQSYNDVSNAYNTLFNKLGLPFVKVSASTGLMGGELSHEYHLLSPAGEDVLQICPTCNKGFNEEIKDKAKLDCKISTCPKTLTKTNGIEIAHAFLLGTKYTSVFKANYMKNKVATPLVMGCFGIGVTRLMAAILETTATEEEMRWPSLIAPHQICVIPQKEGFKAEVTLQLAKELCTDLSDLPNLHHGEVILDDRIDKSIGYRIKDAARVGYPYVIALGKKALQDEPIYELINLLQNTSQFLKKSEIIQFCEQIKTLITYA